MDNNEDLDIDVIVYGEPLPKEKNAYGQDIVVIPMRQDATTVLPYSIRVTVKAETDPNFPSFISTLTIDGYTEKLNYVHHANERVFERHGLDYELLGFVPIRSRSATAASSSSPTGAGGTGTITVKVTNCKITKRTKWKNPSILPRRFDIGVYSVEKEMDELQLQNTKLKTVSAGLRCDFTDAGSTDMGPFCQTITLLYTDWETMEHNRRLTEPELMQREEFESMKSEFNKSKAKQRKLKVKSKPKIVVT